MKKTLLLVIIASFALNSFAQKTIVSKKYKITFTVPNDLEKYDTEAETVLGYENATEDMAVDIEVFPMSEWSAEYINSQKVAALKIGPLLTLKNSYREGFVCPLIKTSYAKLTYDHSEDPKVPVYVVAILNKKAGLVYEATIYNYDLDEAAGKKVAESFKLLD
ncbi:hypothetical protein ACFQ1Q_13225 [Winogradskyella litorisediminis]|uniref:Uncharacterized protein n=1 Tax=Winogradskyella litorisediminis TaxID=1156618 RepID=A0ABW3ND19_9FLAO